MTSFLCAFAAWRDAVPSNPKSAFRNPKSSSVIKQKLHRIQHAPRDVLGGLPPLTSSLRQIFDRRAALALRGPPAVERQKQLVCQFSIVGEGGRQPRDSPALV